MNEQTTVTPEEQEVRDLLWDAGPRDKLPADDLAVIRVAAKQTWRQRVTREDDTPLQLPRRRAGRRAGRRWPGRLALAASLLLVVLGSGWWWLTRTVTPTLVASVEALTGAVTIDEASDGAVPDLVVGAELPAGVVIETQGVDETSEPGRLSLRFAEGSLRLDAGTRLRLLSSHRVALLRGGVYFDSGGSRRVGASAGAEPDSAVETDGAIEIETAFGLVRDIGTQFEVRLDAGDSALRLRVREGVVTLGAGGETHVAVDGEELRLQEDGGLERTDVVPHGDAWSWVLAAAPVPSIDGLPLSEVLQWLSRETGWHLRYEDPSLEPVAAAIEVYAPVEGLTPEQALEVVMTGSGLAYSLETGTLIVGR